MNLWRKLELYGKYIYPNLYWNNSSALNHPNIVRFYGLANVDGFPFIVMEYLPKGSVLDLLRKQGHKLSFKSLYQMY